jgi:hypothetical protein
MQALKLMAIVGVAVVGGTVAANAIDTKFGAKISNDLTTRGHVKTGVTAGIAVGVFGVLNALL